MGSGRRNLGRTWGCASCSSDRAGNETPRNDQYAETPAKQNTKAKTKGDAFVKPSNMVSINNLNKQKNPPKLFTLSVACKNRRHSNYLGVVIRQDFKGHH